MSSLFINTTQKGSRFINNKGFVLFSRNLGCPPNPVPVAGFHPAPTAAVR